MAGRTTTAPQQSPAGKVQLTFASYAFEDATVKATQDIVDSWNVANPDATVIYEKVDPSTRHERLATQLANGTAPDVIHDDAVGLAGFSQRGHLADLGPLLPAAVRSEVSERAWASVTHGGIITGVPTITPVATVFVNTALLQAAGIPVPTAGTPWSWDTLQANARTLTRGPEAYGFAWGLKSPAAALMPAGLAFDGTFVSGDGPKPAMTVGDKELEVPRRIKAMLDAKVMAPASLTLSAPEVLPGFFMGAYAMIMTSCAVARQIGAVSPPGLTWAMIPLLTGTSQNQGITPQTLSITKGSKHPQQAMAFITHYLQAGRLAKVAEGDGLVPVPRAAAEVARTDIGTAFGWDAVLASSPFLVDAPWNRAEKLSQWRYEVADPAYLEFLGGRTDPATLQARLGDGWKGLNA